MEENILLPQKKKLIRVDKLKDTLSIEDINARIKQEVCHKALEQISDKNMKSEYMECKSVKNVIKKFVDILEKYTEKETVEKIIQELLEGDLIIGAGTKGVKRGYMFNKIVKDYITKLELDKERFEVCFEKNCDDHLTSEKPDWYILERSTKKVIIGMNQLDLWGGGQQLNRGSKYIESSEHNNEKSKLLCVVCNEIEITSEDKKYRLFETGFKNNTLCYLNNLKNIINSFFM